MIGFGLLNLGSFNLKLDFESTFLRITIEKNSKTTPKIKTHKCNKIDFNCNLGNLFQVLMLAIPIRKSSLKIHNKKTFDLFTINQPHIEKSSASTITEVKITFMRIKYTLKPETKTN